MVALTTDGHNDFKVLHFGAFDKTNGKENA